MIILPSGSINLNNLNKSSNLKTHIGNHSSTKSRPKPKNSGAQPSNSISESLWEPEIKIYEINKDVQKRFLPHSLVETQASDIPLTLLANSGFVSCREIRSSSPCHLSASATASFAKASSECSAPVTRRKFRKFIRDTTKKIDLILYMRFKSGKSK